MVETKRSYIPTEEIVQTRDNLAVHVGHQAVDEGVTYFYMNYEGTESIAA